MNFTSNHFLLLVILFLLLLLKTCQSLYDDRNPVYINHYFARQLFKYFNESNISHECKIVADYVKNHEDEDWALKLIDASGTIPAGLAKGNFQFLGDFDECLDISVSLDIDSNINLNGFHGQYCLLDLPIELVFVGKSFAALNVSELHLNPTLGVCLPSACSEQDLTQILKTYHNKTGLGVTVSHCTDSKNHQIQWYHILIISGFVALILLASVGTAIDIRFIFTQLELSSKLTKLLVSFSLYTNLFEILESEKNFLLQIVTNAGLWVEAFFLLSGFLCAYGVIRDLRKTSIKDYKPLESVIHRYLRLTPSLIGIIAFSILQEIMGSGPQWFRYVENSEYTCHKYWWTNLLYINNIVGLNQLGQNSTECLAFTWYLAVDMQLFLISPILILLLASNDLKKQYIGIGINVCVILISWIITAVLIVNNGLTPTVLMNVYDLDYINKVYKQSYCRVGPYSVGILMAYFYLKYKGNITIKPVKNIILWIVSLALNLSITFLTWPWLMGNSYHNFGSVLYGTTHRTLWAISWAYVLFACATGHGGIINKILSWQALVPLSRLSFQAYLIHSVLVSRFVNESRQPIYSSKLNLIMMFFQYTLLTFIVSCIAFLMFEIPFSNIERIFWRRQVSKHPRMEATSINNNTHNDYGSNESRMDNTPCSSKL